MKLTALKRNRAFELLGVRPTNPRWSWCALSPDKSRAVFTLWEDLMEDGKSPLSWTDYGKARSAGAADQQRILDRVIRDNIPAYGLVSIAHDIHKTPRSIKEIKPDYLIRLKIEKIGADIFGHHLDAVLFAELAKGAPDSNSLKNDGLDDLASAPSGSETPDRALVSQMVVVRDPKVRAFVVKQAKGKCEYCGASGFEMSSGALYLEAHHIIALAKDGRDTTDNVIALCPEHHRQAHYGKNAEFLEQKFLERIKTRTSEH